MKDYSSMSYYEKNMVKIECLKTELMILKERYEVGHINRDSYLDSILRIDEKISRISIGEYNF